MTRADRALLGACFFTSGATSLLLEVAWSKELSYVLGNTLYAVSTVVAAFMAGLGLGSIVASRRADRFRNPVRTYALLQVAIGACGIGLVHLLRATDPLFAPLYRSLAASPGTFLLVRFAFVFTLLLVPATLMGMTLPVVVGAFGRRERSYDNVAGLIYGVNTVGAVAGTLLGGFLILPSLGLWRSCLLAGVLDTAVALIALPLARRTGAIADLRVEGAVQAATGAPGRAAQAGRAAAPDTPGRAGTAARAAAPGTPGWTGRQWWVAALYGVSGLVALLLEVAWFRLLGLTLGPTVYAFAAMLGVYLAGIGLGSAFFSPWVTRARWPGLWIMAGLETLLGLISLSQLFLYNALPVLYTRVFRSMVGGLGGAGFAPSLLLICGLVVFLPCLVMGALFPAAVRATREAGRELTPEGHVGRLYMLNTAGGIAGSLLTGFWLVPAIGVWRTLILAGLASVGLGTLLMARAARVSARTRAAYLGGTLAAGALLAIAVPSWNVHLYNLGLYQNAYGPNAPSAEGLAAQELIYYRDGINAPVAVYRSPGNVTLYISGKPDASMSGPDLYTQLLIGHLPVSFCAHPRKVAMIGYGSGMTAGAILSHPDVERLDLIEIEQAVFDASPYFAAVNGNPERDPRTRRVLEDGRIHLRCSGEIYDVITSEPSNPWMAGIANLFTVDFYRDVRARLTPGGIFAQWIQGYDITDRTFREVLAGLQGAFAHVILFRTTPGDFMVMASDQAIRVPWEEFRARFARPSVRRTYARIGVRDPLQVAFFFQGSEAALRELTRGTRERNTDDNVRLEYGLPREFMGHAAGGVRPDFELGVIRTVAESRLGALQEMLPGVPLPELLRELVTYPHSLDPDPTAAVVRSDLWHDTRQILARGLETELSRAGRADLAASVADWDREADRHRDTRERLTLELRDFARQARPPDAQTIERALREAPELPYVLLSAGNYLLAGGDEQGAEKAYREAIVQPSGYAYFEALVTLARIHARRGDFESAAQLCEQAIAWNPYYPKAFALLAQIESAAGHPDSAAAAIRRGLYHNPSDADLLKLGARAASSPSR